MLVFCSRFGCDLRNLSNVLDGGNCGLKLLLSLNEFERSSKGSPSSDPYCGDDIVFNSGFPRFGGGLLTSMRVMGVKEEDGGFQEVEGGGIIVLTKLGSGGRGSSGGGGGGASDGSGGNGSALLNSCGGAIDRDGICSKAPGIAGA